jgi:hypothetical protein
VKGRFVRDSTDRERSVCPSMKGAGPLIWLLAGSGFGNFSMLVQMAFLKEISS